MPRSGWIAVGVVLAALGVELIGLRVVAGALALTGAAVMVLVGAAGSRARRVIGPAAIVVLADFVEPDRAESLVLESVGFLPSEIDPDALGELRRARVYAGYAGWGSGQLEDELAREDWILEEAQPDDAFTEAPGELWADVLRRKGGIYELVARMPEDPSVN